MDLARQQSLLNNYIQSPGAIPTRFGATVFSSCSFVHEHWIDLELLPIDSSAYFSPRSSEF